MQEVFDVFISYSRKDYVDDKMKVIPGNDVSKIKDALSEAGITYWFDENGIYSGQNFVEKIVTNIENARIFIFLSTVNSNKSPWTCKEIVSADEFKKHIIPIRIDSSPYNKKVLFRIADLDYIEYYINPQKGIEDLIMSIKKHLDDLAAEEKRKAEEKKRRQEEERQKEEQLKRKKDQETKRLQEEQKKLISEIKLSCTALNNEEAKLELDRENLILKAQRVLDSSLRDALIKQIKEGGVIHKKYQEECVSLTKEVEKLRMKCTVFAEELQKSKEEIRNLQKALAPQPSHGNGSRGDIQASSSQQNRFVDDFCNAINTCLKKKYAVFSGRASLSEFWYFFLFICLITYTSLLLTYFFGEIFLWLGIIASVVLICPYISVSVRRLHDMGKADGGG